MSEVSASKVAGLRRNKFALIAIVLLALLLSSMLTGYLLVSRKVHKILPGNPIDAVTSNQPLQVADGRTSFLLFGTSYDDPNPKHTGGYLTDSLIVLSVDTHAKSAYTMSVPRDLWVTYDTDCKLGGQGKINAAYVCAMQAYGSDKDKASRALADKVGAVLGLPVQYYVEVNYTFIQTLTDALSGIDVDIYSHDERGIYDPAVGLKLPAGINHLDGKAALKLSRARNSSGGYGLPRSNFDREINQQRVVAALFKKASAEGKLNDFGAALKLINALSGQVRTNVQSAELRSAMTTARSLDPKKIVSVPLTDYVTTGSMGSQSIVRPLAGLNEYTAIQTYVSDKLHAGDKE